MSNLQCPRLCMLHLTIHKGSSGTHRHSSTTRHLRSIPVEDILYAIFEQLAVPEGMWFDYDVSKRLEPADGHMTEQGRRLAVNKATLATCARVCRAFFEPAISVLWRDLDDLEAIFALEKFKDAYDMGVSTPPEASQSVNSWIFLARPPSRTKVTETRAISRTC
ncbi:hypothetical protein C8Q80DRAFT_246289 [Daedaleopsis nitida]|nr:hypothetical protein C8Q80DRAFT_246289 [Daedaleopsis nitida]